ncbi:MAG: L-dopachrome tautomerase-related protein [Bacteroidota bacterium]
MKSSTHALCLLLFLLFSACGTESPQQSEKNDVAAAAPSPPTLEVVAEMDINPGNVSVSSTGKVFTSIHPMRATDLQLVELTGPKSYAAFPNAEFQSSPDNKSDERFDTPLGTLFDGKDRLWVIDPGLNIGKTRVFAFDINNRKQLMRFDVPAELAPSTSFVQDIAVDDQNGWVYLADFGNPGIIAINLAGGSFRKLTHLPSMQSEDIDMIVDGKAQLFNGAPARIGLNPITLSADGEQLYYGAMNGTKWYGLSTKPIREGKEDADILATLTTAGPKPISDGAATDSKGNHYFTNLANNSIDRLDAEGNLQTLVKDPRLDWPDNVRLLNDEWLYIAVNQLHKTSAFTGDADLGKPPYLIMRVKL